ncbi:MAG: alpha/beta fold hydrolase, partial [Cyanobacteria bacterium P01_G01_bin.19]
MDKLVNTSSLVGGKERNRLSKQTTLIDRLQEQESRQPHKRAFTFLADGETETDSLTYRQLNRKAKAIASVLQGKNAQGQRALLLYQPGLDFITAFLGCLYAGAVAVPVYPPRANRSIERLMAIVRDAKASFALTTELIRDRVSDKFASDRAAEKIAFIATDSLETNLAGDWYYPDITADSLAFLQYTSGSTGKPKGVMVSHGNVMANSATINHCFQNKREHTAVSWLPPYHDMGLIGCIIQPMYVGLSMYLMAPVTFLQRPYRWLQAIARYGGVTNGGPNFAYDLCVDRVTPEQKANLDLSCWELAFSGAEPVRAETIDRFSEYFQECGFRREAFYPCYGMAESTLMITGGNKYHSPVTRTFDNKKIEQNLAIPAAEKANEVVLVGSGKNIPGQKIAIANPDTLKQCAAGEIGEIWAKSDSVARGYWQRSELSKRNFNAVLADTNEGGWLRTGDLGFLQDGELFVTGRLKDLIIIHGRNYYPQDIESTVEDAHEAIRIGNIAAFALEVEGKEKLVVTSEIKRTHLRQLDVDEVTQAIRNAIARNHDLQTQAIVLLKTGSIPKTSSGKIQRHACKAGYVAGSLNSVGEYKLSQGRAKNIPVFSPVTSHNSKLGLKNEKYQQIQAWLTANLARRLGINETQVYTDEPFASSGLSSVDAVSLSADLEDWLDIKLSPTIVFDYPNINELAAYLSQTNNQQLTTNNQYAKRYTTRAQCPLGQLPTNNQQDIAIIGMGCRFPGANDPQEFWQLLKNGQDEISKSDRWSEASYGGFINDVDRFDPQFFGITPREAQSIDPQQRLLLEVSWAALEDAAIANRDLMGSNTGVFVGMSSSDYSQLRFHYGVDVDAYAGTGNAHSIAANRLSYLYDLKGPSMAVDTACSSSLVAIHLASQSLKTGECDRAIAGGVNLMLSPELTQTFSLAGMMAKDGRCKTFDADADGYVRGEGCGVVVLKRLTDARRDGDRILAVIKGSAINQDGKSNGLTAPNGLSQQTVIRQALVNAGVEARELGYVESHGTGTSLGDPIEVNSLKAVLGEEKEQSCYLGSLKTNIGHLEAAAGVAGLIKTVLCLQNRAIPPNLNFRALNPLIDLADTGIAIPQQLQPWEADRRYAGISSFGFGGTNAHIILEAEQRQKETKTANISAPARQLEILTLSAKSEAALKDLVLSYKDYLAEYPTANLADICHTAQVGRTHFDYRLAIACESKEQLQSKLALFTAGEKKAGIVADKTRKNNRVAFLFTGQGSQYVNMGYQLYQTQPVFKQALDRCAEILDGYLEKPLLEALYPELSTANPSSLDETVYTQPAIFALEYALAQMWMSWGILPSALIGHSVGEYVAATVAGVFSLEDGLKLVATRGKLMQSLSHEGEMHAVFASEVEVERVIQPLQAKVAIAAINTAQSIVISGDKAAVRQAIKKFTVNKIKTQQLKVSHAFHSPLMQPILAEFQQVAESIEYHSPQIELISNVTGEIATDSTIDAEYWVNHVVAPVRFAAGMETLQQKNCNIFLEIGSKPILLGMGRSALSNSKKSDREWLPSLRPRKQDWQQIINSLSVLYARGLDLDWQSFASANNSQKIALPTYPFQRQSYWLTPKQASNQKTEVFAPSRSQSELKPDFYRVNWQLKSNNIVLETDNRAATKPWLIIEDCDGLGTQLASQLKSENCLLVNHKNLTSDYLSQLLKQHKDIQRVIYLAGLEQIELPDINHINNYQRLHCTNILNLLQSLYAESINAPVWLATRGCQSIDEKLTPDSIAASCLWGWANAISMEHPELWGGIIDLSQEPSINEQNNLFAIVASPKEKEDRFVLRQDKVYVSRLHRIEELTANKTLTISSKGSYLITGGLGSLGLQIARWLVEKGAKNLILLGRSEPNKNARTIINKLELQGVIVETILADITDYDVLESAISPSAIKGIIHAAGVLDDGLIQGQTWNRFNQVIAPKVTGAWNLHRLTKSIDLDFFVLFSSVASLIGSPGQSNYTVANAGLDAIACYRRSQDLPATSINWGAWGESGMAVNQGFKIKGLNLIPPQAGLDALVKVLSSNLPRVGIVDADWQELSQKFSALQESNYFAELVTQSDSRDNSTSNRQILAELLALEGEKRTEYLTKYLQRAIAEILQIEVSNLSVEASLLDIGMDSLMVMEAINQLKADLQLILYPREFYEHPQIASLAKYLAEELAKTHQETDKKEPKAVIGNNSVGVTSKLSPAAFILSSPRSGSTLLRVMLAGHPQLSSPPELHLLPFETMAERESELGVSQLGEGLKRAFMALKNISAAESQALVESLIEENLSVAQVYQMLQQLAGDRLLLDKSPTYASQRETLDNAEKIFDRPKYIHLVRHPYSVIESFTRMRMDKLVGSGENDPYAMAELIWRNSNQNILNFAEDIAPERYHLVYYEDLVSHPRQVMAGICQFLEVPFDEAVLTPYQGDRMTDGVSSSAMSVGDPNFLARQTIDAKLAEAWREIELPNPLGTYTKQLAQQLEYELTEESQDGILPMQETLINIRGLKICLCTWGPEEGPLVLCLHGILEQGAAWSEVAIDLAQKGYRVIAPDLRGHGRSDRVGRGGSYNLIDFLGDIDAIVENLAGKAFILVGHSLGSVLGAIFATIRPQRIKNIVLVETILPTANEDEDPTASLTNQLDRMAAPPEHPVFPDV